MKISQNGIDLIKKYEGLRLEAYLCPAGVWTIGYGHTKGVKQGMKITEEQAEAYLRKDCESSEKAVNALGKNLNQNQFDALVSFTFNCGAGNLKTLCYNRKLSVIGEKILLYNKGGGKVLAGLVRRRKDEQALFLKPVAEVDKSLEEVAREVLDGKWGNGAERKKKLAEAGYIYKEVQSVVNKLLKK